MDTKALRQLTYGVYLVTARDEDGRQVGCVVNTAMQLTSSPYRLAVTMNHENRTLAAIRRTRAFAVTCLTQAADMDLVGTFGFAHSDERDKFAGRPTGHTQAGIPYVTQAAGAVIECSLMTAVDAGTHDVLIGDVTDAIVLDDKTPALTYAYYHGVLKGTTPPRASSFVGEAPASDAAQAAPHSAPVDAPAQAAPATHHFQCQLCGYVYETTEEELPADFVCPLCGAAATMFERID